MSKVFLYMPQKTSVLWLTRLHRLRLEIYWKTNLHPIQEKPFLMIVWKKKKDQFLNILVFMDLYTNPVLT